MVPTLSLLVAWEVVVLTTSGAAIDKQVGITITFEFQSSMQYVHSFPWWRHQMEIFSALLAICAGNSPVPGEFPAQRPVTRSFDVFFDLRPNKRLSKQCWGWWFETPSRPLWHYCNVYWPLHWHCGNRKIHVVNERLYKSIVDNPVKTST